LEKMGELPSIHPTTVVAYVPKNSVFHGFSMAFFDVWMGPKPPAMSAMNFCWLSAFHDGEPLESLESRGSNWADLQETLYILFG
jgi:enamine deaminase RidA (YjgF/YER057c/UK114 family)